MTAILYPVAANGEQALLAAVRRAARQRDAERLAGQEVVFATETVGPAFASREAALEAYAGKVEDDRPGRGVVAAEDRFCRLAEVAAPETRRPLPGPVKPAYADGRRWPAPPVKPPATVWRLQVSFWRIVTADQPGPAPQARQARRDAEAARLDAESLRAIARQPLRPVRPQQPLDIGLFETRLPESPDTIVPDE